MYRILPQHVHVCSVYFFVQVMVCLTPHSFSIKTTGSQLPQSKLHVFTKENGTKKLNRDFTHFHLCFLKAGKTLKFVSQALGRGLRSDWKTGA